MNRRWPTVLRGLLAALALAALVAGPPLLLAREVGWPLPTALPSWSEVAHTISTGAVEDATIIKTLAVLVWLAWANFSSGVLLEAVATARGRFGRSVAGFRTSQQLAANLLATVAVAASLLARPMTATAPSDLRLAVATVPDDGALLSGESSLDGSRLPRAALGRAFPTTGTATPPRPDTAGVGSAPSRYTVQQGDTFWDLAERFLGDGLRWREIRDLNVGSQQPDGTSIGAGTEDLRPEWELLVPNADRSVGTDNDLEDGGAGPAEVLVEDGDTLWEIADEHLDDPERWGELYESNRGAPQPDGGTLVDPDLIQPGWLLEVPSVSEDAVAPDGTSPTADEQSLPPSEPEAPDDPSAAEADSATNAHVESPNMAAEADGEDEDAGDVVLVPIAAAGTLTAGLVLTLDRIRRARLRRRHAHHRIPMPTGQEAAAERRLRSRADTDNALFLNLAVRELSGHLTDQHEPPQVVLVTHGSDDLAAHLDAASDNAPEGWECQEDGLRWSRSRPPLPDTLQGHAGTPSLLPCLVTVGSTGDDRAALLNLADMRFLTITGFDTAVKQLLQAWALELATTARADALDVVAVGIEGLPDDLERLTCLESAAALEEYLTQATQTSGGSRLPRTAVLATGLPATTERTLLNATESRIDLVAVATGAPSDGQRSLQVLADGTGRLEPDGLTFQLLDLGMDIVPLTAKLIQQALHDPDQLVPFPPATGGGGAMEPEREEQSDEAAAVATADPSIEVRVLGPVEVTGAVHPFRTNKTIELIVYLALHRSGADTDTLLEALWPEQPPRPARLYTEASRARKALASAPDGTPHLPDAQLGRYRLAPSVGLDRERFAAQVAAAHRDPDQAIDHLRRALSLVRGLPLSSTATEYGWAASETYALSQEIVDAAHELSVLYRETGSCHDAIWAAEQGLLADPLAEVLVRDIMEAAAVSGDTSRVHAAMTRLRRQVAEDADANDADDWLDPATTNLFARLT